MNARIPLSRELLTDAATSTVTIGIVAGLVIGKPLGIVLATWIAVRSGVLPAGTTWRSIVGAGTLAGIGFTVSLFIAGLAFDDPTQVDDAKVGVLAASFIAALVGAGLLSGNGSASASADTAGDAKEEGTPVLAFRG